ncbi:MAG: carboxypeptidase-like regulatory domain-containing protein [Pyrinomonadaceae bacterium]
MKTLLHFMLSLSCVAALMLAPLIGAAAASQTCGGIKGRVTTEDGAVIPGAGIRLVDKKTKQRTNAQTTGEGEYSVCLAEGVYDVFADALAFKPAKRKSIKVDARSKSIIDFVMKRGKPVVVDESHP